MSNAEKAFTNKGFKVLGRAHYMQPPQNPRDRAEAAVGALNVGAEQIVKALALQVKAESAPLLYLMPAGDRTDLKVLSRALGTELDFFPLDQLPTAFGGSVDALSPFEAAARNIRIAADGRVFDQETIVIPSGDPLEDLQVASDELRSFLGSRLEITDLESARNQGKSGVIEPRVLKGFRDYLPDEMLPRQGMIATIMQVFERFGFVPLQTPALEYSDILLGKLGGDAEKLLFRFRDNGGRDVCLRYDLTVPLARVAAQYQDLVKPFKRYQIAPVWRAEKPGRGRFREFFQCDCDIVGSASLLYDAECIALDFAVMEALGVNAQVRFNNRKVLAALGQSLAVQDERQMMAIFRTIDKIPSQGMPRVKELLASDANCSPDQIEKIARFVAIDGANDVMLAQLQELLGASAQAAIDELRRVKDYVEALSATTLAAKPAALKLDFSIARGLDYYTGTVYETFLLDLPNTGSVMSGGRYDGLIERYSGKPMPAVGISVGIDRLFSYLVELGKIRTQSAASRVLVVAMDAQCLMPALKVLGQFRAAGIAAEMAIENEAKPKMDKQLSLAGKKNIPFAAILGSNEVAKGTLMLKDLATRQQEELTTEQALARLKG